MTNWEALFLGIIQGVTEFLPVSSSGHLELSEYFLGFQDLHRYILFNLISHVGTLCAIFFIFATQIKQSLTNRSRFFQIVLGTLPLFPLVLIMKPIKAVFDQPQYLGICFMITSLLLFAGIFFRFRKNPTQGWQGALTVGLFQAVAILPGISRSGATISAARILGWQKEDAITFSFLLAIPAILGGTVLEVLQWVRLPSSEMAPIGFTQFLISFLTSFVIGSLALKLLIRMTVQDKWSYFAWYCLILGTLTTLYFNFG